MPPDNLKVTSSELRHAAALVETARTEAAIAASTANNDLRARSAGWVGDSKKALDDAVSELREHSESLTKRLAAESKHVITAADRYAKTEAKNAAKLAADSGNKPALNMDH